MKKTSRYIVKSIIAISFMVGAMSGVAFASGISLSATMQNSGIYEAHMHHDYPGNRYCEILILEGESYTSANTLGFASGVLSPNTDMYIQRQVNGKYGFSTGIVYNSTIPYSGIAASSHTECLNPNYYN